MSRIVDLSHGLAAGMPSYPGLPAPRFGTFLTHAESAARGSYAPGVTFQMATLELTGNTGTYVDAPFHRYGEREDLAGVPLERLANLPGVIVTALPEAGVERWGIGAEALEGLEVRGRAVLVRTGWAGRWGTDGTDGYFRSGPFLTRDGAETLVQSGAALVGIDCANVDDMQDPERPAHSILLAAGIPIVEHLRGLEQLPAEGFRFFAAPPAIKGGTSFTVRALAVVD